MGFIYFKSYIHVFTLLQHKHLYLSPVLTSIIIPSDWHPQTEGSRWAASSCLLRVLGALVPAGHSGSEAGLLAEVRQRAFGSQEDAPGWPRVSGYRDEDFTLLFSRGSVMALALNINYLLISVYCAPPHQEKSILIALYTRKQWHCRVLTRWAAPAHMFWNE